jgi:hypothetical protein
MNKRLWIPSLLIVSLLTLAYAIYRSSAERVTAVENGHEVVYGEPQHGLILGLCIFSGICVVCAVALLSGSPNPTIDNPPISNRKGF